MLFGFRWLAELAVDGHIFELRLAQAPGNAAENIQSLTAFAFPVVIIVQRDLIPPSD